MMKPKLQLKLLGLRFFWLLIAFIVFLADRLSKLWALKNLPFELPKVVIPHCFNLYLDFNTGMAFSLFGSNSFERSAGDSAFFYNLIRFFLLNIFPVLIILVLIYFLLFLKKSRGCIFFLGLSFILGGALGNVLDRWVNGYVVDFIQWYFKSYFWPTFNLADSFICVGFILVFLSLFYFNPIQSNPIKK